MKREEIVKKTLAVFQTIFGKIEHLNEQISADDIDKWDSLNHVILIQELEKAFGMKFDLFEIIEIKDVTGLVDHIYSKSNE
jgi:acyl carrier protein